MISIFLPDSNVISKWSGGQTNQLYIYPKEADFKTGNFNIRISTATVEIAESVFTKLPDVNRTLVVLEGQMTLNHLNHHQKTLHPYEMDHFSGGWETTSKGCCTDFNLMTKGKVTSVVSILDLKMGELKEVHLSEGQYFIYSHQQNVVVDYAGNHVLHQKELAVFTPKFKSNTITLLSQKDCHVICIHTGF